MLSGWKQTHSGVKRSVLSIILFAPHCWQLISLTTQHKTTLGGAGGIYVKPQPQKKLFKAFVASWIQKPLWKRNWFLGMYFIFFILFFYIFFCYKIHRWSIILQHGLTRLIAQLRSNFCYMLQILFCVFQRTVNTWRVDMAFKLTHEIPSIYASMCDLETELSIHIFINKEVWTIAIIALDYTHVIVYSHGVLNS